MKLLGYYVAGRDQLGDGGNYGRTRLAVGPFRDRASADRYVAPVRDEAMKLDPMAGVFVDFGTGAIEAESLVPAPGNRLFGLALDDDGYVLTAETLIDAMTSPDFAVTT